VIVLDTSVLYAATDRSDTHHPRCRDWLNSNTEALLMLPTVLAEACYLIDRALGPRAEAAFLSDVGVDESHAYQLANLVDVDIRRMTELVRDYAGRHLGGTDASIVAVSERLNIDTVATINRRDFDNVRPRHRRSLNIVPQ
jgi:predicted nucleic acid-binding protein